MRLAKLITGQFPDHQIAWKILGVIFGQTGQISQALRATQRSAYLVPEDPEAHYNLANVLCHLGRLEEAEASFNQAIALQSDFASAHCNLGEMMRQQGRLDEAEVTLKQAITLKTDLFQAHANLGSTLLALGKLKEAVSSYGQAIALKPDLAAAHHGRGLAFYRIEEIDLAIENFRKVAVFNPDYGTFTEFPEVTDTAFKKFLTWDKELGWKPKAGLRKKDRNDSWVQVKSIGVDSYYSIDQYGSRTGFPDYDGDSIRKVGLFGDSFCMSRRVNDDETIGWYLGKKTRLEVRNYGVGGYGIDQALLRLEQVLSAECTDKKYTDIIFIITPYTLARALSIYRHYLEPGNIFAVKSCLALGSDGRHIVIPSPVDTKEQLKSLDQFLHYFHKYDIHYRNKAWLIDNLETYYSSFWRSEKEIFFSIIQALGKLQEIHSIQISVVATWGRAFLERHNSAVITPWVDTFNEAQRCYPSIRCVDIMPTVIETLTDLNKVWLRDGEGHLSARANYCSADIIAKEILLL